MERLRPAGRRCADLERQNLSLEKRVSEESLNLLTDLIAKAKTAGADAADAILADGESTSVTYRLGEL